MEKEPKLQSSLKTNKSIDIKTHEKFLKIAGKFSGMYSVVSANPLIFYVARSRNPVSAFRDSYQFLFENLRGKRAYFLCVWYYHIEEPRHIEVVKQLENELLRQYPNLKFFHLCNTLRQTEVFQQFELNAIFCNQNCLIDERIFKPLPNIGKKYDAVYDARFLKIKRHYLASEINNLALIYAQNYLEDFDADFIRETQKLLSHAHSFNHSKSGKYQILESADINQYLNECRIGLCLSPVEGAMYASGQYLLSGLPVVSTESLGGRDVFFDERYTNIVEATPKAVKQGVEELINRNLSTEFVRQSTIEKMDVHRQRFISLVQNIYDEEGVKRNFRDEWDKIFFDKMVKSQSHLATLKMLKAE
ncbi:MAG: hypothetical protein K1X72_27780 [Pyrinomonadaceae bacterium]|nr:hypothetical protein [Pyrinomonadaceae bacterium]